MPTQVPAVRAHLAAVAVLLESVGVDVPRPFSAKVVEGRALLDGVRGDAYVSVPPGPAVVLVPGAAPADDPRAVRTARSIARAGRTVFVPRLALGRAELDDRDVVRLVRAVRAVGARTRTRPALLGFSLGGSYCLVAAADPRISEGVAMVATFGAAFDLEATIGASTTGRDPETGRRLAPMPEARAGIARVLREMGADPRGIRALLRNRDPELSLSLLDRAAPGLRARLGSLSPSSVADRIEAPVVAMHAARDPLVPETELRALARGLPNARTVPVEGFQHVDIAEIKPGDAWGAWRFTAWLLRAQEGAGIRVGPSM